MARLRVGDVVYAFPDERCSHGFDLLIWLQEHCGAQTSDESWLKVLRVQKEQKERKDDHGPA